MGFIMHKYFLSKGLKAPPPSDGKKKKAQRRYSQPGGGTLSEQLSIPEHAYADSSTSKLTKSPGTTARRRRRNSLATTTPTTSASYRRGSMPMLSTTSIAEGSMEDSTSMLSGEEQSMNGSMMTYQNSFRRSSLQHSSLYEDKAARTPQGSQDFSYQDLPEDSTANPYANYYAAVPGDFENPASRTTENEYGYEDAVPHLQQQRRYPRRSSASSGISLADETVESEGGATMTSSRRPTRVRQENKWLQLQLDQAYKSCQELESQLYGTRDQLVSTEAMWRKQWHAAEQRHQDEILQVQRQAEQASNAILSQELEALRDAMYQMAQTTSTTKEETKEPDTMVVDIPSKSRGVSISGDQNVDVSQLQAELQEWKSRHAQVTQDSKHLQETLLQESRDQKALLKESERRIQWLEEELHTATSSQQNKNEEDDLTQVRLVAMLQSHRSQLEDRVEELLVENANLQEEQTKVYAMEGQVQHLKESLEEARQELEEEKFRNTQQLEQVQTETDDYKARVANLQEQISLQAQEATQQEETMRAEYELQIKELQSEKARLQELFHQKEENWNHELNLKNQTIEDLQSKMAVLDLNSSFVDTPPIEEEEGDDIARVFTPSAPEEAEEDDLFQEQPPVSTEDEDFSISRDLDLDSSFVESPPMDEEENEVVDKAEIEHDNGDMFEDQPPMSADDDVPLAGGDDASQTSFLDASPLVDEEDDDAPGAEPKANEDEDNMFEDQPPMSADDDVPLAGGEDASQTSFLDTSPLVDEEDDDAPEAEPKSNEDEDDMFEDQPPMSADDDWSVADDDDDASQTSFLDTSPLVDEEDDDAPEAEPKANEDEDDMFEDQPPISADGDWSVADDDDDASQSSFVSTPPLADERAGVVVGEAGPEDGDDDDMFQEQPPMSDDEDVPLVSADDEGDDISFVEGSLENMDQMDDDDDSSHSNDADTAALADKLAVLELREKELSRQIHRISASEAKTKRLLELARKKIHGLESYIEQDDLDDNMSQDLAPMEDDEFSSSEKEALPSKPMDQTVETEYEDDSLSTQDEEETAAARINPSSDDAHIVDKLAAAEQREQELSRQIDLLWARDAKTKRLLELARKKIQSLESHLEHERSGNDQTTVL